ncbi:MAG: ROK family protein [Verrucomicrobiae bacterium]|nr:ROK family protein [Verrucomicrobiae bacterium]
MNNDLRLLLAKPAVVPPLEPNFRPISLGNRKYRQAVAKASKKEPLGLALERNDGCISVFKTEVFSPGSEYDQDTLVYIERLVKFLLWQKGGWKLTVAGPEQIGKGIQKIYSDKGGRAFDVDLMGRVYEKSFVVEVVPFNQLPKQHESAMALGGHMEGCRIGFDLGASDYKISAVKDGEAVFTTELPWDPKVEPDPSFHYRKINEGLKLAASHLPRVDAIGGSSAGIIINNKVKVASLFRAVPKDLFEKKVRNIFMDLQKEWGIPFEVANDGDVTALAGGLSLKAHSVLGVAMGSSEAAGFLDNEGRITGWLNELAFAPVDYQPNGPADEWSKDLGVGAQYFSQQAVVRLAPVAGIQLPEGHQAVQLKFVQDLHKKGDKRTRQIFETIGVYLGYALAHYADMYGCKHLLILGRVTSGEAGDIIIKRAREVLETEFPEYAKTLELHLPDEKSKRVGQAVAAASLPETAKK